MKRKHVDNFRLDALFALLQQLDPRPVELTEYGKQIYQQALEDDANGLCEECDNPFDENE